MRFRLGSSRPEKALVRCHVFGPAGEFLPLYARNLLLDKKGVTFLFPSALNDAPGRYTVRVTDVLTGATAEAQITLQ